MPKLNSFSTITNHTIRHIILKKNYINEELEKDKDMVNLLIKAIEIDKEKERVRKSNKLMNRTILINAFKKRDLHLLLEVCFIIMKEKFDKLCDC